MSIVAERLTGASGASDANSSRLKLDGHELELWNRDALATVLTIKANDVEVRYELDRWQAQMIASWLIRGKRQ